MSDPGPLPPPPPPTSATVAQPRAAWYKRHWLHLVAVGVVGFVLGAGAGFASVDPTSSSEYKALQADLSESQEKADRVNEVDEREAALDQRESELDVRATDADELDAELSEREKAVGLKETEVENNTITDGIYEVGEDIKAGTYKTKGGASCYYAILNSPDTSDIADNNNITGPGILTVRKGQYLELSNCADWVLQ